MKKVSVLLCLCLLFVGCGVGSDIVTVEGSTSLELMLGFLTEGYEKETGKRVNFNPTGSSAGIEAVLSGRCSVGAVSRELTVTESEKLDLIPLAIDTIVVIVNLQNPIMDLSVDEISAIFKGEVTNWSALGGSDRPIVPVGREQGSGTRDVFETATDTKGKCRYIQELTSAGDVIAAVRSNENAIGYTSLEAVGDNVRVLSFNGVAPTIDNITSSTYRLGRRFSLVVSKDRRLSEAEREFLIFAISEKGAHYIELCGAIPLYGRR